MNGSNGNIVALLQRIADGQDRLEKNLRSEIKAGFARVNGRLDNMLVFMGEHHEDHEQRIQALERRVSKKGA